MYQVHSLAAARLRRTRRVIRSSPVTTTRVDPLVLQLAQHLADGCDVHVVIVSADTVYLRNGPRRPR